MTVELDYRMTQQIHRDVVLGKDTSVPRGIAINMLPSSKLPDSVNLLKKVLDDDREKPEFRHLAAINLWRINTPAAHELLFQAAETVKDPQVLTAVVKCLGRVGDERALTTLRAVQSGARGILAAQASFAASLICFRLGLPGHELPVPPAYVEMPSTSPVRLSFIAPPPAEADLFFRCLANEPYGIAFSRDSLLQYSCPGGASILALNRQIAEGAVLEVITERKTFLGVLASKNSEDGRYSTSYLVLTSPEARVSKANILIHRITGEPAWAGTTTSLTRDRATFMIRTVGRIGIVPTELEGTLTAQGKLSITKAVSAGRVLEKRQPRRLDVAPS